MQKMLLPIFVIVFANLKAQTMQQIADTLQNMPANTWYTLPNSAATPVLFSDATKTNIWASSGPSAITNAWGGGAYDKVHHRFFIWGGGHSDYHGNEVYVFKTDSFLWRRITEPSADSIVAFPQGDADPLPDGKPVSRHTYGNLVYMNNVDKLFSGGGGLPYSTGPANKTWTFDYNTKTWDNRLPSGVPLAGINSYWNFSSAYDPNTGNVFLKTEWNIMRYNYATNTWWQSSNLNISPTGNVGCACIVPNKNLFLRIGNGVLFAYNTVGDTIENWDLLPSNTNIGFCTGIAYDSIGDEVLAIKKDSLWGLNLATKVWTPKTYTISPASLGADGPFGRWQYLPEYNVFMLVASTSDNVYFYKNSVGAGTLSSYPLSIQTIQTIPLDKSKENGKSLQVSIKPNPVYDQLNLHFYDEKTQKVTYQLIDLMGKVLLQGNLYKNLNTKDFIISTQGIGKGVYNLNLDSYGQKRSLRVVKL